MLKEIQCNGFRSNGKVREPIRFHMGLNTVLGGYSAENSIGKSTMLAIIDFCFGGDTFSKEEKIADHVGTVYPINFTFEFSDEQFHFSRQEDCPDKVWKCHNDYVRKEEITIDDFRSFLKQKYEIREPSVTFRGFVDVCSRFNGKYNIIPSQPITTYQHENARKAIDGLEKLFEKYHIVADLREQSDGSKNKKETYNAARKYEFLPSQITKRQYNLNVEEIARLKNSLASVAKRVDDSVSEDDYRNAILLEDLKNQRKGLKRKRSELLSSQKAIATNIETGHLPVAKDLEQLQYFFPGVDLKNIDTVIGFHKKIEGILMKEMEEESLRLDLMLKTVNDELKAIDAEIHKMDVPVNIDIKAFEEYAGLKEDISKLEAINRSYELYIKLQEEHKVAKAKLESTEASLLEEITAKINYELKRLNKIIYGDDRETHILSIKSSGSSYSYVNSKDKGTGTAYKSLLIFDLSLLSLCNVPFLIHDSLLFKNIGDQPVEKIMNLYGNYNNKQLFISFDKINAYSGDTPQILKDSSVIYLSENGNELYGFSWAKKKDKT